MIKPSEISDILKKQLDEVDSKINFEEVGTVLEVGDGVAHVYGLENVRSSELIEFENGVHGVAMNLEESNVGVILLDNVDKVTENMTARRTGEIASLPVGEGLLGRVINTLGEPIDGAGPIQGDLIRLPLERKAPGVIFRQPVNEPLQTGIKAIDSMVPIGRGQRELIIGDRQIGKTAIAIDTIINQRDNYKNGNPLYCIYVAIGQKASSVAALVNTLKEHGALDYTVVLAANASDSAAMRYYAPFAGAAIGEYFRDSGRHALVIYDDLSKQAVSYREISLILRRPSGREAYPGDIFYLHSRLLERAAKIINNDEVASSMNDLPEVMKPMVKGGGSLTALPIIETQAGDVSAYIPTNVISITDGQIFLETALFNQGVRPAINVGISVSRVGVNAQVKAMKKIAGTLKIDQAQFRELESFTKFGGDVDPVTAMTIDKGRKNERILIQPQYSPVPVEEEIAIIYCGTQGLLHNVPMDKVAEFEKLYLQILKSKYSHEVMDELRAGHLDDKIAALMTEVAEEVANRFKAQTMASMRDLKGRIGSVASSEKITGAMKMISSAKMHKAESALRRVRPFRDQIQNTIDHLISADAEYSSPLTEIRPVKRRAIVLLSSDEGLCGAFNMNLFKRTLEIINQARMAETENPVMFVVYPIGKKASKFAQKLVGDNVDVTADEMTAKSSAEDIARFTGELTREFIAGKVDCVEVVYTHYKSASKQILATRQLLPIAADDLATGEKVERNKPYLFEPDVNTIYNEVLPLYVLSSMQEAICSNRVSEQAARVMAMQSANDNAKELLDELQLEYNKLRQQSITSELLDIIGGKVD